MALSLAEIILLGIIINYLFRKIHLPGIIGLIISGVFLGPNGFNIISTELMDISADLRLLALIVILMRAGLELSTKTVSKVGFTAALLSFIPSVVETAIITFTAPLLFGIDRVTALLMGSIIAAVSPAVIVPTMVDFIKKGIGAKNSIPTLTLAYSSLNTVYAMVVYSIALGIYLGNGGNIYMKLMSVPISILTGLAAGIVMGFLLILIYDKFKPRDTKKLLIFFAVAIIMYRIEPFISQFISFSALVSVVVSGVVLLEKREHIAHKLSSKVSSLWIFAEIILFTFVGAQVDVSLAFKSGLLGVLLITLGLIGAMFAIFLIIIRKDYTLGERAFVVTSYIPKATVQAAVGSFPLAVMKARGMDTAPGELILVMSVLSIIFTAPIGAMAISVLGNRFLDKTDERSDAKVALLESENQGQELEDI